MGVEREVNRKTGVEREGMGFESEGDCMWRVKKVMDCGHGE